MRENYNQFEIIDKKHSTYIQITDWISKMFNNIQFLYSYLGSINTTENHILNYNQTEEFIKYKNMCLSHELPVLLRHSSDTFNKKNYDIHNEYIDIINTDINFNQNGLFGMNDENDSNFNIKYSHFVDQTIIDIFIV